MKRKLKLLVYAVAKWTGMFALSRRLMRRRLIILCYHGFERVDEAQFRPSLFMRKDTFAARMGRLRALGHPVLPLGSAVERLRDGSLPNNSVAITIDDGFYSVLSEAAPVLRSHDLPSTLYVTSYYVVKGTPIFRLLVQYLFWKTTRTELSMPALELGDIDLRDAAQREQVVWRIIEHGENRCSEPERQALARQLAEALGLDYDTVNSQRSFSLLTPDELRELRDYGIDIQLHTHRHRFPDDDPATCSRELQQNHATLAPLASSELVHFCYPSGEWSPRVLDTLQEHGIRSATTCQAGLNDPSTNPLALYRILDADDLHMLEFEAELAGFDEMLRIAMRRRRRTDQLHAALGT